MPPNLATLERTVATGVRWLLRSRQPEGAILFHLGLDTWLEDLRVGFCPSGSRTPLVVSCERPTEAYQWLDGALGILLNPLTPAECATVERGIRLGGATVADRWNSAAEALPRFVTGSWGLAEVPSAGVAQALAAYRAGCPEHPEKTVFCGCGWYQRGSALLRRPRFPSGRTGRR